MSKIFIDISINAGNINAKCTQDGDTYVNELSAKQLVGIYKTGLTTLLKPQFTVIVFDVRAVNRTGLSNDLIVYVNNVRNEDWKRTVRTHIEDMYRNFIENFDMKEESLVIN